MGLVLKYVQEPSEERDYYRYRRRVPQELRQYVGKGELVGRLGATREAALKAYPQLHQGFERELELARKKLKAHAATRPFGELTDRERYDLLIARLRELGIDNPLTSAIDDVEAEQRQLIADDIASKYEEDPDTGHPMISDRDDVFLIRSLMTKAPAKPLPSFEDAIKLYVTDKISGTALDVKKKLQRVNRIVERTKTALGRSPRVDEFSREDARKVRDYMLELPDLKPSSVRRELNIVKAIINHAITEFELSCTNPFNRLKIAGLDDENESDKRDPFPDDVLAKVRANVHAKANDELRLIWRLLEGTGARLAEITGLRMADVTVEGDTPNVRVTWHEDRRVKTKASKRYVPLVGDALAAAKEAHQCAQGRLMLFAQYGNENGPTNASQGLMKRVRDVTNNERLVVHSLRHNMKDRLMLAEVTELDQNLILGHSLGGVGNRVYGGDAAKLKATTAAMKRAFGLV